jgi:hypothetical protein
MSKLVWDGVGKRTYQTGVDHGVLYPMGESTYGAGVAWDGLTSVQESPSGAENTPLYADNIKYLNLTSAEEYGCTIEAYDSPEEFDECDGTKEIAPGVKIGQQNRKKFGFSYRSLLGNDVKGNEYGYVIHLVYGCTAAPSEKQHSTVNDSPEAATLSWTISTTPVNVTGGKPTATVEIDSTKVDPTKLAALEAILYGTDGEQGAEGTAPRLPLPDEIATLVGSEG